MNKNLDEPNLLNKINNNKNKNHINKISELHETDLNIMSNFVHHLNFIS